MSGRNGDGCYISLKKKVDGMTRVKGERRKQMGNKRDERDKEKKNICMYV